MVNISPVPQACGSTWGTANSDLGYGLYRQVATLTQNGTTAVNATFYIPAVDPVCTVDIVDIIVDVTTAFDSATSATLTVGRTSAGTEYASGVNAKTTGRVRPTFTTTQLTNMIGNTQANNTIVATITPVGATTVGTVTVTILYAAVSTGGVN